MRLKQFVSVSACVCLLCLVCSCAPSPVSPGDSPTTATKGTLSATTPFAPTTPLVLHVTDREGRPLAGAEITYGFLTIDGQEEVDDIEYRAGITDGSGQIRIDWADGQYGKVSFHVAGGDDRTSGTIERRVSREDVQNGLTLSLKDAK